MLEQLETLPEGRRDKFSLGGWSMGGVLAVEMLLQLRRQGKSLASVILVDSPAPIEGTTVLEDEAASLVQFAKDIVAHDERSSRLPLASSCALGYTASGGRRALRQHGSRRDTRTRRLRPP